MSSLKKNIRFHGEAYNFGPAYNDRLKVIEVVKLMKKNWPKIKWKTSLQKSNFYESKLLFLNSNKAKKNLGWSCILNSKESIKLTSEWYKVFYSKDKKKFKTTINQIEKYEKILRNKKKL